MIKLVGIGHWDVHLGNLVLDSIELLYARLQELRFFIVMQHLSELSRALDQLPGRQREVVVLRMLEGLSTRETVRVIGCREGTVKVHLHRALNDLKDDTRPKN